MATIKYYTGKDSNNNPIWTNLKDIVWPKYTTAPINLSGASLGGGQWTLRRRPLAQWAPTGNNNISLTTTIQNIAGSASTWGASPTNYFSTDSNGVGIKVDGAFILYLKWVVAFLGVTQATLYLRTATDNGTLTEYTGLTGYIQTVANYSSGCWMGSSNTTIVRGKDTTGTQKWHKPAWKTNNNMTAKISSSTKLEICPAARVNYWEKTSL